MIKQLSHQLSVENIFFH